MTGWNGTAGLLARFATEVEPVVLEVEPLVPPEVLLWPRLEFPKLLPVLPPVVFELPKPPVLPFWLELLLLLPKLDVEVEVC